MRLLIITQAIDREDKTLGFFHGWVEELSARFETIEVVCLKKGVFALPRNVRVHSLGKERGATRFTYLTSLYRYVFSLRYDAVFVHMNEEYVLLAGLYWMLTRKRVVLWRNHRKGSWRTRLAVRLASVVCYTSPEAFVASFAKAQRLPLGIDTVLFSHGSHDHSGRVLFLGRLDPVKQPELYIESLLLLHKEGVSFQASMYGDPTHDTSYKDLLTRKGQELIDAGKLSFNPGVTHDETAKLYKEYGIYVNLTPSGSFDKTIGEAMASGCVVVSGNGAVLGIIRDELFVREFDTASSAQAIKAALTLSAEARRQEGEKLRVWVEAHHSLPKLVEGLERIIK